MTREKAIEILKRNCYGFNPLNFDRTYLINTALDMAIEALEQEPILDKIRAEIEHLTITEGGEDYTRKMTELYSLKIKVLQIIDKYKAESEG